MYKYQQLLVKNVRENLEKWTSDTKPIAQSEVYRFLHSIKGTGATIGMERASQIANELMKKLNEEEEKGWEADELQSFLLPLISLFYYEGYQKTFIQEEETDAHEGDFDLLLLFAENPAVIMHTKESLESEGYVVFAVTDPEQVQSSYYEFKPKAVFIGGDAEKKEKWNVLKEIRQHANRELIPLIILDHEDTSESRIKQYLKGADEVLPALKNPQELFVRSHHLLKRKQQIDQFVLLDELTRVYNRKHLEASYGQLKNKLDRKNEPFSMVMIDIDWFKDINDTYGHPVGDRVLESLAQLLKDQLRKVDTIIRYGGEEFLILLPTASAEQGKEIMKRVLVNFQSIKFDVEDMTPFSCTFSAGVHEVMDSKSTLKENMDLTDKALYKAKETGRNHVLTTEEIQRKSLKKRISVAIIDDDPIIRTMLFELLKKSILNETYQLDIESFQNGKKFIESSWNEKKTPYLILLDGIMPEMDGLEVLKRLRQRTDQKKFTILMLTSRDSEEDIASAIQLGADDYLTKPFKMLELNARIGYLVKRMK